MDKNGSDVVRVGIYVRVSTAGQAEREHPLDVQEDLCRQWAKRRFGDDGFVAELYSDKGISGGQGLVDENGHGREGLTRLMTDVLDGRLDVVITQDLDRLTRSGRVWFAELADQLADSGVELWTLKGRVDPSDLNDRLTTSILVAVAEHQRLQTAAKVRAGLRKRAEEGYPTTKVPYGWRWESADDLAPNERRGMEPVPAEREHVLWMVDQYLSGDGAGEICQELNRRGVPGPGGDQWNVTSVRNTVFHPGHSGQIEIPNEDSLVRGDHWDERFYDPEEYDEIMREKERRSRRRGRTEHSVHILSGTITCGLCGRNLVGAQSNNSRRRYQCPRGVDGGAPICGGVSVIAEGLEEAVVEAVLELAASPDIMADAEEVAEELLDSRDEDLQQDMIRARETIAGLQQQRERWTNAYTEGAIEIDRFREHEQKVVEQLEQAQGYLTELEQQTQDRDDIVAELKRVHEALTDLEQCWDALSYEQQRQMIDLVVRELTIEPEGDDVRATLKLHFGEERDWLIPASSHQRVKATSGVDALTPTELAILALLDEGLEPIQISRRRGVSRACTHTHLYNIRTKLSVDTNEEAIETTRERVVETRRFLPTEPVEDPTELTSKPKLTDDQRDVLRLINEGLTYAEVGERLDKSESNIKYFSRALFRKLGVENRRELVLKARHTGVVPPPDDAPEGEEGDEDVKVQKWGRKRGHTVQSADDIQTAKSRTLGRPT